MLENRKGQLLNNYLLPLDSWENKAYLVTKDNNDSNIKKRLNILHKYRTQLDTKIKAILVSTPKGLPEPSPMLNT